MRLPRLQTNSFFWLRERGDTLVPRGHRVWDFSTACRWAFSPVGQSANLQTNLQRVPDTIFSSGYIYPTICDPLVSRI